MQYVIATLYVLFWLALAAAVALVLPRWALPVALVQLAIAYVVVRSSLLGAVDADDER